MIPKRAFNRTSRAAPRVPMLSYRRKTFLIKVHIHSLRFPFFDCFGQSRHYGRKEESRLLWKLNHAQQAILREATAPIPHHGFHMDLPSPREWDRPMWRGGPTTESNSPSHTTNKEAFPRPLTYFLITP